MKKEPLEKVFDVYYDKINDLIDTLPDKGDKCSDSQKLCLVQALHELDYVVNGLQEEDFIKEEE